MWESTAYLKTVAIAKIVHKGRLPRRYAPRNDGTTLNYISHKKLGCRNIPSDSPKRYLVYFFAFETDSKPPSTRGCIKGGIFRKAMPENRSLLIVNEDFEGEHNAKITLLNSFFVSCSR